MTLSLCEGMLCKVYKLMFQQGRHRRIVVELRSLSLLTAQLEIMLTTEDILKADETGSPVTLQTAPYDPRFPNTNQSKNCWQNYVDFHKCQRAKGEEYEPCYRFKRIYKILCPSFWVENWDTALEEGRIPFKLDPPNKPTETKH